MKVSADLVHPGVTCLNRPMVRDLPPILPIGPNAFNSIALASFINDVIPLPDPEILSNFEIQVTGRICSSLQIPIPPPLKYCGVVSDYTARLSRSAFMIAPTFVGTGQQVKIFEALSYGIPVIAYRNAVPADILTGNPSIIAVNSPVELASAISSLIMNPSLLRQYWSKARVAAETQQGIRSSLPYCRSLGSALSK